MPRSKLATMKKPASASDFAPSIPASAQGGRPASVAADNADASTTSDADGAGLASGWQRWWRSLAPHRQDRFAALAPMAAVVLFLVAIAGTCGPRKLSAKKKPWAAMWSTPSSAYACACWSGRSKFCASPAIFRWMPRKPTNSCCGPNPWSANTRSCKPTAHCRGGLVRWRHGRPVCPGASTGATGLCSTHCP